MHSRVSTCLPARACFHMWVFAFLFSLTFSELLTGVLELLERPWVSVPASCTRSSLTHQAVFRRPQTPGARTPPATIPEGPSLGGAGVKNLALDSGLNSHPDFVRPA